MSTDADKAVIDESCSTPISYRLPDDVVPVHYTLKLKIDLEKKCFEGRVVVDLNVVRPTNRIAFNAKDIKITSVSISSSNSEFQQQSPTSIQYTTDGNPKDECEQVWLDFPAEIGKGSGYQLSLEFHADLRTDMTGLYYSHYEHKQSSAAGAIGQLKPLGVTQFESNYARRCFPCWDEPKLKATFDTTLETKIGLVALSNMSEKSRSEDAATGRQTIQFHRTPLMSTYLCAFVVGELDHIKEKDADGVEIRVFAPLGKQEQGRFALNVAVKTLPFYKEYFGQPYPLDKLDLVAIPDFQSGAMENWGLVTYREILLLLDMKNSSARVKQFVALVVGHELAHMWFGNLVTMSWWDDLWLNEGFASWIEYLCVDMCCPEFDIWTRFVVADMGEAFRFDALLSSHPIQVEVQSPNEVDSIFDSISYAKSSCIIRMLNDFLSTPVFRDGLRLYMERHRYGNTVTVNLWSALETVSKQPVARIMSTWTKQMGFPMLWCRPIMNEAGTHTTQIALRQRRFLISAASAASLSPEQDYLWFVPVTVCAMDDSNHVIARFLMQPTHDEQVFTLPDGPHSGHVRINPHSCGFYYVNYTDAAHLAELRRALAEGRLDHKDRITLIGQMFALVKSGNSSNLRDVLELCSAFRGERNYKVWAALISELRDLRNQLDQHGIALTRFNAWQENLVSKCFETLGMEPPTSSDAGGEEEAPDDKMLRPLILGVMGRAGNERVKQAARQMWEAHLRALAVPVSSISSTTLSQETVENSSSAAEASTAGARQIPADIRGAVYSIIMRHGGESEVREEEASRIAMQQMMKVYECADQQEERVRIYSSFASVHEGVLGEAMEFLVSDRVRLQDRSRNLTMVAGQSASGQKLVWNFLKTNWPKKQATDSDDKQTETTGAIAGGTSGEKTVTSVSPGDKQWLEMLNAYDLRELMESATESFASREELAEVRAFFKENPSKVPLTEQQIFENVENNCSLWEREGVTLCEMFK